MKETTRQFLMENSETQYKEFAESLIPGVGNILGVRLPVLRKKAKELAKGDWKQELETEDIYYEEIMLRGMTISYAKGSIEEMLPYIAAFIPKVDNWSVCDSVFSKMDVLRTDREKTWEFIRPYLYSDKEFEVRCAVIIMMQHLLKSDKDGKTRKRLQIITEEDCFSKRQLPHGQDTDENPWLSKVLEALNRPFLQYYASMAAAWTIAEGFCCYPAEVFTFLKDNKLDDETYRRALQKITESLIPQAEVKKLIKGMRNRTK